MINEYVNLYRYSKIAQGDTVINAIITFASTNKKIQERAIRKYETDVEEKKNKPPLSERMRATRVNSLGTKLDNHNRRLIDEAPKQRAAMQSHRLFANGVA